ncbi:hypothetical protein DEU56DRAFT_49191 [Suillus clintonianus]|uniref:uncharacterized protein n=1 Tax=Suillus clintonianus TaxID=1904413 RepID=UPI001B873C98|nr:uncharacterized protein DEU56DRAFT_49191 [Suillus clintonianus]KAG2123469.1 hypothetical protein DEU56DRAFT_49191 [Suillus clintonianus]
MIQILGGYHISLQSARALNKLLSIDDTQIEDHCIYKPMNDWLVANDKPQFLVGCHTWPDVPGSSLRVFLFTQCRYSHENMQLPLAEHHLDRKLKKWLEGNIHTAVEWVTLEDRYGFAAMGDQLARKPQLRLSPGKSYTLAEYLALPDLPDNETIRSMRSLHLRQEAERQREST